MEETVETSILTRRKFVVEIDLENAAFGDGDDSPEMAIEVARILREVASNMYEGMRPYAGPRPHRAVLMDYNGARVGHAEFKEE